jgi:predicted TIM-barrel fold metal-dependent hydrolase
MGDEASDQSRPYVVISSDNHAGADLLDYKTYLEKKWHDEFDDWAASYTNPWVFLDPRVPEEGQPEEDLILVAASSWHSPLNWDSTKRIRHMENDGVVAEVVFPNTAPPFMPTSVLAGTVPQTRPEYDRRWAGLRAHNRWLLDFCAEYPGRRAGVAQLMLYDIDDAVSEVRALRAAGLTGGILLPMDGVEGASVPLHSPDYEPLWSVCEELTVPVHKHASEPTAEPDSNRPELIAIGMVEFAFFNHRALAHLIFSGVFERHPGLRFVLTETGSGWVPDHLNVLDGIYKVGKARQQGTLKPIFTAAVEPLSMLPSEYFARNCYLGASLFMPAEARARHQIGVDRIMWGVDYPHAEGCFPYSREAMRLTFAGVPEPEVRMMLSETAARVYEFDLDYLQTLADKVGPSVSEIAEPLVKLPKVPEDTYSAVFDRGLEDVGLLRATG